MDMGTGTGIRWVCCCNTNISCGLFYIVVFYELRLVRGKKEAEFKGFFLSCVDSCELLFFSVRFLVLPIFGIWAILSGTGSWRSYWGETV